MSRWGWEGWGRYVPVAERRAKARKKMDKLRKQGKHILPVEIEGRTIAKSFWGKGWCDHLESFSDYANRLPRGRTYVRNGSVCHLEMAPGVIRATVSGSELYDVAITIEQLVPHKWKAIKERCSGRIGSILELLQGRLSDQVMRIVADRKEGLFPLPEEISLSCSCPDWAVMCKHVAAVLYGIGNRLDTQPELLFLLRGVDAGELITSGISLPAAEAGLQDTLREEELASIFGIDMDQETPMPAGKDKAAGARAKRPAAATKAKAPARPVPKAGTVLKTRVVPKAVEKAGAVLKTGPSGRASEKPTAPKKIAASPKPKGPPEIQEQPKVLRKDKAPVRIKAPAPFVPTGRKIAALRKQLGFSVAAFAEKVGVTPASVYRWENAKGKLNVQARPLAALRALNESVRDPRGAP